LALKMLPFNLPPIGLLMEYSVGLLLFYSSCAFAVFEREGPFGTEGEGVVSMRTGEGV